MPQLLLQGFPEGASRICPVVSILKKDGRVTYFVGPDNYFSHPDDDQSSFRFAIATLIANHDKISRKNNAPNMADGLSPRWGDN